MRLITLLILSLCMHIALAQDPLAHAFESDDWIYFKEDLRIAPGQVFEAHSKAFGLTDHDEMVLNRESRDKLNWSHFQYQQHHQGLPVEFAIYHIHAQDGNAVKGNGKLVPQLNVTSQPQLSEQDALDLALQCIGAATYYWEVPALERLKQHATDDPEATFFPKGELLIADQDFNDANPDQWHIAWKFEIYAHTPEGRDWIYIDAVTGEVLKELDLDIHDHFQGIAETRYSGLQTIIADSTDAGFVLRDPTRGKGIETYDAQDSSDMQYAVDFIDDDNYWDNANIRADDAATDAHWATAQFYDYLLNRHGIDSYNGKGSKLICYVHVRQNWRNARWTGFWTEYGDAGGEPWTYIDVVGHEFAHGFTRANSALIYSRESGALNESFSDILGEATQHYAFGGEVDWIATPAPVDTIRDYINPNNLEDPDTYLGDFWVTESVDNYGVHSNSAVQNHWFYLLSEGGSGINDHGDAYDVQSIGFEAAMDIVIRNATTYLTPSSGFIDARQGSLFAAEDLFGSCSFEYRQVAQAWYAVGVGEPVEIEDFTIVSVSEYPLCDLADEAMVSVTIKHLGCDSTGPLSLDMKLQKSNTLVIKSETVEFNDGLAPGEVFTYTFSEPFDFSRTGAHDLEAEVIASGDLNTGNNKSETVQAFNLSQVTDHTFKFYTGIAPRTFRDSLAFMSGEFADLRVVFNAGRDNTPGLRIEGERARNALPILPGQDLFDFNQKVGAQVCMCVEAGGLESLSLRFDLRQTFAPNRLEENIEVEQPPSSALRVLVDGEELSRYFPLTYQDDKWQTHEVPLNAYLGQTFSLCFETRTIQSQNDDPMGIGDRVFLDNIRMEAEEIASSTRAVDNQVPMIVYPNPATDVITILLETEDQGKAVTSLYDINGAEVFTTERSAVAGGGAIELDVSHLPAGVYVVKVRQEAVISTARLLIGQ